MLVGSEKTIPEFTSFYRPNYHDTFYLEFVNDLAVVEILFDDGDVKIRFKNDKTGIEFIHRWELCVSLAQIEREIDKCSKAHAALTQLKKSFQKKIK